MNMLKAVVLRTLVVGAIVPAYAQAQQMSFNNITTYTNASANNGVVLVVGLTLAPSGTVAVHKYSASTTLITAGGVQHTAFAAGSGYQAAQSELYWTYTDADPDGLLQISTLHQATCPIAGTFLYVPTLASNYYLVSTYFGNPIPAPPTASLLCTYQGYLCTPPTQPSCGLLPYPVVNDAKIVCPTGVRARWLAYIRQKGSPTENTCIGRGQFVSQGGKCS
jgi:hypothetical protein